LRSFAPDAALIPALSEAVADRDASVRAAAIWLLDNYAEKLRFPAPEATLEALEDRSREVRLAAATALRHIRAGVEPMVPALIRHAGHDPDEGVRAVCTGALRDLRPPAVTDAVVPMYIEAIERRESPPSLRSNLIRALPHFGPAAKAAVPALLRLLQRARDRKSAPDAAVIAEVVRKLAPGSSEAGRALAVLREFLEVEPNLQPMPVVIDAVARFGPEAAAALPRLRELEKSRDPQVGVASRTAIAAIEVPDRSDEVVGSSPGRQPSGPSPPG
jgi:HEAT repeat protein